MILKQAEIFSSQQCKVFVVHDRGIITALQG